MSEFLSGNMFLVFSLLCGATSQILFKALFNETGPLEFTWSYFQALGSYGRLFRIAAALVLLAAAFLTYMLSLSRLELSYAYPVACSSALLVAFFSIVFLGEAVSLRVWLGTAFIVLGTILVVPQPEPSRSQPASGIAHPAGDSQAVSGKVP